MDNLERVMREFLEQGATMEGIAKNFTDTLNKIKKEEEDKKTHKSLVKEHDRIFHENYKNECLDKNDAASLCFLVVESDHPEWNYEDCQMFIKTIRQNIDLTEKMIGKNFEGMLRDLYDEFFSGSDRRIVEKFLKSMGS